MARADPLGLDVDARVVLEVVFGRHAVRRTLVLDLVVKRGRLDDERILLAAFDLPVQLDGLGDEPVRIDQLVGLVVGVLGDYELLEAVEVAHDASPFWTCASVVLGSQCASRSIVRPKRSLTERSSASET